MAARRAAVFQAVARLPRVRVAWRHRRAVRPPPRGVLSAGPRTSFVDMNDIPTQTLEQRRARYDVQGERTDAERVASAMTRFVKDFGRDAALYLDACIRCGHCADACHFYLATGEARYTPIWKLELFRRTYKREAGPFAWLHRLLDSGSTITADALGEWQALIYDACTMCGR